MKKFDAQILKIDDKIVETMFKDVDVFGKIPDDAPIRLAINLRTQSVINYLSNQSITTLQLSP